LPDPPLRVAFLPDFPEEQWPSMDMCAEMLLKQWHGDPSMRIDAQTRCPRFRRRFTRVPVLGSHSASRNADRLYNRFITYPRLLRSLHSSYDFFHLCDQSYAHLLHSLPEGRVGVYCHDLDVLRCLLQPETEPRPRWFRAMMRSVRDGLVKAAVVFCSTEPLRQQVLAQGLADEQSVRLAPYGVAGEFRPGTDPVDPQLLLHVGSCIPRKRIDVLLAVVARVRQHRPGVRLLQIGGEWTEAQRKQLAELKLHDAVTQVRGISRDELAAHYRRAALVLQPSDAEGFGLPVTEALACGAPVLASDLPTLKAVGGDAVTYAPVGDVDRWTACIMSHLADPQEAPALASRLAQASRYSWNQHARTIADAYHELAARRGTVRR